MALEVEQVLQVKKIDSGRPRCINHLAGPEAEAAGRDDEVGRLVSGADVKLRLGQLTHGG